MLNFQFESVAIWEGRQTVVYNAFASEDEVTDDQGVNKPPDEKARRYRQVYLLSAVGLHIVVSVLIGLGIGLGLDRLLDTKPWMMLLFVFLGMFAGFINLYREVMRATREDDKREKEALEEEE